MSSTPDLEHLQTPLVHLYRGELGRMTSYRVRLDTTTNWAVGTNAALLSLALSDEVLSVATLFPVALILNSIFLWLEARRYRGFEMIRNRVRLLEIGLYARQLGAEDAAPSDWLAQLRDSLADPKPPLGYLRAMSVRLRRIYVWLIGLTYVAWGIDVIQGDGLSAARLGPISGLGMVVFAALLLPLILVATFIHEAPEEG